MILILSSTNASIDTLEWLSPAARRIADDLTGEDFASFVTKIGGPEEQRAVAVVPDKLAAAMGAEAGIVRLSSYTVLKQRERGQNLYSIRLQTRSRHVG